MNYPPNPPSASANPKDRGYVSAGYPIRQIRLSAYPPTALEVDEPFVDRCLNATVEIPDGMVVLLCTIVSRFQEASVRAVDSAGHLTSISHLISGSHLGFTVIIGLWFIFFLEQFCTKADPLRIGAGVAGITVPLLHGSRLLLDDLQRNIGALNALETPKTDLSSISMALTLPKAVKDVGWELLGDVVVYQAKASSQSNATCFERINNVGRNLTQENYHGKTEPPLASSSNAK
ncbi:hypothetical protein V1508DRAFT_443068 [Lipomyces doorenjongii]|uniref:uncharacterized protein n=1 Tax=Lipomyces doorenjongii TaxID=383834 RepID=UPI0034CD2339